MAEAVEKNGGAISFLDDSEDFIQPHLDSHLPPNVGVIEKEREDKQGFLEATEADGLLDQNENPRVH